MNDKPIRATQAASTLSAGLGYAVTVRPRGDGLYTITGHDGNKSGPWFAIWDGKVIPPAEALLAHIEDTRVPNTGTLL